MDHCSTKMTFFPFVLGLHYRAQFSFANILLRRSRSYDIYRYIVLAASTHISPFLSSLHTFKCSYYQSSITICYNVCSVLPWKSTLISFSLNNKSFCPRFNYYHDRNDVLCYHHCHTNLLRQGIQFHSHRILITFTFYCITKTQQSSIVVWTLLIWLRYLFLRQVRWQ